MDKGRKEGEVRGPTKLMPDTLQIVSDCLGPKQGCHGRELSGNRSLRACSQRFSINKSGMAPDVKLFFFNYISTVLKL